MNLKIVKSVKNKDHILVDESHCGRVAEYAYRTAVSLGLDREICKDVLLAAKYHDVGKTYLDKSILNKVGQLTDDEREHLKYHVLYSAAIAIEKSFNVNVIRYIFSHHENFDGSGYPSGLKDRNIPEGARIIRIADFFDALTNDRVYRKRFSRTEAIEIIYSNRHLFDPDILDKFMDNLLTGSEIVLL